MLIPDYRASGPCQGRNFKTPVCIDFPVTRRGFLLFVLRIVFRPLILPVSSRNQMEANIQGSINGQFQRYRRLPVFSVIPGTPD
jgi:hypothetical protein